jgi:hypothetical protein
MNSCMNMIAAAQPALTVPMNFGTRRGRLNPVGTANRGPFKPYVGHKSGHRPDGLKASR